MSEVRCFWLEPTGTKQIRLRRYAGGPCSVNRYGYHDSETPIAVVPQDDADALPNVDHADPHWPKACVCGYAYTDADSWQVSSDRLYCRSDTSETLVLTDAPAGAMWNADWMPEKFCGPDGICLMVRTPGGDWGPDMASTQGTPWQRTGTPPNITARPSILIYDRDGKPGYHAFLTDGILKEC